MANNRITYATAQLAFKDNRYDPTNRILGWLPNARLAANVNGTSTSFTFKRLNNNQGASLSGVWGNNGMFRVKTGTGRTELIRFTTWATASSLTGAGVTRHAAGSTSGSHLNGDLVQLIGWEVPLGVQSVSIGTTFNTEDVFTLGQLDPYENVEGTPEVEVSVERVFDGTKPLWLIATDYDFTTLKGRTASYKTDIAVTVYPDTQDSATGTADSVVCVSGAVVSAWGANFSTDGNFTETMTLVANDKTWGGEEGTPSGHFLVSNAYNAAIVGSGVQRSEDFDRTNSTLPADVPNPDHIQSVDVSVDIGRDDIFELGRKTPFFRTVSFPVTVTTTFETISDKGDLVNALGTGVSNLQSRTIIIKTKEGLTINLGTNNKISNVTFEGFDAGGGNGTVTYEYTNSNSLTITHTGFPDPYSTNTDRYTGDNHA